MSAEVGRCGRAAPALAGARRREHCRLPWGHPGWHRSDQGSEWTTGEHGPAAGVRLIGGPYDGARTTLTSTPERITVAGVTYVRIDDPDTGAFLGGYAHQEDSR